MGEMRGLRELEGSRDLFGDFYNNIEINHWFAKKNALANPDGVIARLAERSDGL